MLNIFKKVEETRQGTGDVKNTGFEPPKNLPDLARDICEHESPIYNVDISSNLSSSSSKVLEPNKNAVPQLDLSLMRQQLTSFQKSSDNLSSASQPLTPTNSQGNIQSAMQQQTASQVPMFQLPTTSSSYFISQQSQDSQNILINQICITNQMLLQLLQTQLSSQSPLQQVNYVQPNDVQSNEFLLKQSDLQLNSQLTKQSSLISENTHTTDNSGFFKELEDHIKNNGFNNVIIDGLLDKNLLNRMLFYHTLKDETIPCYTSNAEFSSSINLRLEELKNLEKNWTLNNSKLNLLKKLGSTIESDVNLKSEELKKIISESKKIGKIVKLDDSFGNDKNSSIDLLKSNNYFNNSINSSNNSNNISGINIANNNNNINTNISPNSNNDVSSAINSFNSVISKTADNNFSNVSSISSTGSSDSYATTSLSANLNNSSSFLLSKSRLDEYVVSDSSKYFYAQNGQIFKSLNEFMSGLEDMDDGTFNYHVNSIKNDFSNWIQNIFGDVSFSDAIRFIMTKDKLLYYLKHSIN